MSRLTRKNKYEGETLYGSPIGTKCDDFDQLQNVYNKLGQLEDIMEKHNIDNLTDLEIALNYYDHRFDDIQTERIDENETHNDLVDKLGCSLEIGPALRKIVPLLLAYKQGYVYTQNIKGELVKEEVLSQVGLNTKNEWCVVTRKSIILDKDYGKTWWLVSDKENK